MTKKRALVAGGLGLVGRGIVDHLIERGDWEVLSLSRRKPDFENGATYISANALDADEVTNALRAYRGITHVFFTAFTARPSYAEEVQPNLAMLENVVKAVEATSDRLEHVNLMQGTKAYGTHLGPYRTPARESDPRHMPPNFYYSQEDHLKERSAKASWSWSAMRPRIVCGPYACTPWNTSLVIAVYASISKELGLPLRFPGVPGAYSPIVQAVDTAQLARASVWAATTAACAGQIFNVTNGSMFRWNQLWPRFAEYFGMECAEPQAIKFSKMMSDKASLWSAMVKKYGLRDHDYRELLEWEDADFVLNTTYDSIADVTKLIKFGFYDIVDDEEMFFRQFDSFRRQKIIPTF